MSSSEPVARIDLSALAHNYAEVRRLVGPEPDILAMVKADAYGHGAVRVAQSLVALGCRNLGVATLAEAEAIREVRGEAAIVVFGGLDATEAERAVSLGVEIVVYTRELLTALASAATAAGSRVRIHVKVDTGMHRLGVDPESVADFVAEALECAGVEVVALCSHFAMAESVSTAVTAGQFETMQRIARELARSGVRLPMHLANSAAVMTRPETHLDMVRPGLMLYGLYPAPSMVNVAALRPVMRLEAAVVRLADVGPGEGVGYGHSYRTKEARRIATLRCGYADGLPRAMSNRGFVAVGEKTLPVVGRVCMDHVMIDATEVKLNLGDSVTVWGTEPVATEKTAERINTISYELVARLGPRVRRVYEGGGD